MLISALRKLLVRQRGRDGQPPRLASPQLEELEERQLLSADPATTPTPGTGAVAAYEAQMQNLPKGNPNIIFLGDSITYAFGYQQGGSVWNSTMAPLGSLDLGVPGQTTGNILWQVESGLLNGTNPSWVVLMIGTNNLLGGESPQETAAGIAADVQAIHGALPNAHILVLGVLPSTYISTTTVAQTNALAAAALPTFPFAGQVRFLNLDPAFEQANGSVNTGLLADGIHPNAAGYTVEAQALQVFFQTQQSQPPLPFPPGLGMPMPFEDSPQQVYEPLFGGGMAPPPMVPNLIWGPGRR